MWVQVFGKTSQSINNKLSRGKNFSKVRLKKPELIHQSSVAPVAQPWSRPILNLDFVGKDKLAKKTRGGQPKLCKGSVGAGLGDDSSICNNEAV